eukprot:9439560-Alexandrium_andersonii.AAC.1
MSASPALSSGGPSPRPRPSMARTLCSAAKSAPPTPSTPTPSHGYRTPPTIPDIVSPYTRAAPTPPPVSAPTTPTQKATPPTPEPGWYSEEELKNHFQPEQVFRAALKFGV